MTGKSLSSEADSISLVTSSHNDTAQYHLMELTPDMVRYFEEVEADKTRGSKRNREEKDEEAEEDGARRGSRLCIKGRHADEAVLCTPTQTFTLREMTQSNSLLLCSLKDLGKEKADCVIEVCSNVAEIWELTPTVARTGRITQLLKDSLYHGEGEEEETQGEKTKRYTPQQVASIVQASPKELQEGIRDSYVILLDGFYRMVASNCLMESLQILLNYLDLNAYPYENIPLQSTLSALVQEHNMNSELTEAILLRWFGKQKVLDEVDAEEVSSSIELNVKAVVRFIGLQLLETQAKASPILLKDFLLQWEQNTGVNLADQIKVELLKGHYLTFPAPPIVPSDSNSTTIQYFASADLPTEPATRLRTLFQTRAQWTLDELSPFLNDIAVDAKKRDSILLKYARTTVAKVPLPESKQDRKARLRKGITDGPTKNLQLYSARLRYG